MCYNKDICHPPLLHIYNTAGCTDTLSWTCVVDVVQQSLLCIKVKTDHTIQTC